MPLHQAIQRLLLLGVRFEATEPAGEAQPPAELMPLIEAIAPVHRAFDARAILHGNRYRSGFWTIYMLSAIAVLFAVLPLALGWDDARHLLHPYSGVWAVGEVCLIVTVAAIYWRGNRGDWQGKWLVARTTAELTSYLPLVAPLVDFGRPATEANWYARVFDPGERAEAADDLDALCLQCQPLARRLLAAAWESPAFVQAYASWAIGVLSAQRHYHHRIAVRQHALLHRVHRLNGWLFGMTAFGATMHLVVHTLWLSLVTTFFPALAASLHGALAQSEAYRLSVTSERLVGDLGAAVGRIDALLARLDPAPAIGDVKASIEAAIAILLQEHQDWHMLVRPHGLPLG
jgi:hypothetical protein